MLTKYTPVPSATMCTCARERELKKEKREEKKNIHHYAVRVPFLCIGWFVNWKKIYFFSKYVALSSLAKYLGAGFSEGDQKTRQERDKKTKKKIVRVMLEGDSSEQQLIVILSRMRGWDFIAWSFRGV